MLACDRECMPPDDPNHGCGCTRSPDENWSPCITPTQYVRQVCSGGACTPTGGCLPMWADCNGTPDTCDTELVLPWVQFPICG
jgi:hypothetical protein